LCHILGKGRVIQFVVDTGVMFTYCDYTSLKAGICEADFADKEIKFLHGGFVNGLPVDFINAG